MWPLDLVKREAHRRDACATEMQLVGRASPPATFIWFPIGQEGAQVRKYAANPKKLVGSITMVFTTDI